MNEGIGNAKLIQKASLAACIMDHPENTGEPFIVCPRDEAVLPPRGQRHDPHPAGSLLIVGLFIALGIGLFMYIAWQHALDKNKPHIPPKNMPMVVVGALQ